MLEIEVKKEFGESTVCKILDLVENASQKKSESEKFITKFAKFYTPIVVVIAICLVVFPSIVLGYGPFQTWLYRALSFLVVSCPCALVISIPLSFFAGIGAASKLGILIKGSNYIEKIANLGTVVFDKTGTLTEGVFEIQKIEAKNISNEELLEIVAHAENYSNHPIADSVKKLYSKEIDKEKIKDIQEIAGEGIKAKIEEKEILVGNEKLMLENKIDFEKSEEVGTIIYVAIDKEYKGYILISDKIKKDSKKAIEDLNKIGITQTIMLTGDKREIAKDVARKLELKAVYSELLPDGKVEKLEEIIKYNENKKGVAFVGDGINDSPVIAMADVGIAMGKERYRCSNRNSRCRNNDRRTI